MLFLDQRFIMVGDRMLAFHYCYLITGFKEGKIHKSLEAYDLSD